MKLPLRVLVARDSGKVYTTKHIPGGDCAEAAVPAPEPSSPPEVLDVEPPAAVLTGYVQSLDTLTATDLPVDHATLTVTQPLSGTVNAMVLSVVRLPEHVLPAMIPAVVSIKYCPLAPDTSKVRLSPAVMSPPHAMTVPVLASLTFVLIP